MLQFLFCIHAWNPWLPIFRNNKGDSLTASYYHLVNKESGTAAGAELTHSFSTKENTLSFGMQHALDPLTTVKARYNNHGMVSALIQHEWRPKSFLTLSAEVDTKAIDKASKVGLSLVLKPWCPPSWWRWFDDDDPFFWYTSRTGWYRPVSAASDV